MELEEHLGRSRLYRRLTSDSLLASLGLRADEVATLKLDDIDWRASEMLVRAKGRQRTRMPMPPDIGAGHRCIFAYWPPKSSCRRLFVRMFAPHVGFSSGSAITWIATTTLDRVGVMQTLRNLMEMVSDGFRFRVWRDGFRHGAHFRL